MKKHHRINYIELPSDNLPAIKEFYSKAFGWKFTDYGTEYVAFSDGTMEGGFTAGEVSGEVGILVILYSDNIENSLKTVEQFGGKITKPIFKFPGGRRFHFLDPAGNELAIWSDE